MSMAAAWSRRNDAPTPPLHCVPIKLDIAPSKVKGGAFARAFDAEMKAAYADGIRQQLKEQSFLVGLGGWIEDEEYRPGWRAAVAWLERREQMQKLDAKLEERAALEWPWPSRT